MIVIPKTDNGRTIKLDVISEEQIIKEGLELMCDFGGILQYALGEERYYLRRLLAYKSAYYVVAYQDGVK